MAKPSDRARASTRMPAPPPPHDGTHLLPECWALFHEVVAFSDRVLLYGPPGTGKTRRALEIAVGGTQAVYSVILTEETPAAELRGHWIPDPSGFVWLDGAAVRAWKAGARLVLDEIDHASGDVMNLLMAIVDAQETACLTLPNGEVLRPARGFSVIATMNGDPDQLPPALRDRFTVAIEIDAVHPAALAALPPHIRQAAEATALLPKERRLSVRSWVQFAHLREHVDELTAAKVTFGRALAKDILDAVRLATAGQ
jgi:MoxR-like ATPase